MQLLPAFHVDDEANDNEDDDVAHDEEGDESDDDDCSVAVVSRPGEEVHTEIIPKSAHHTWIIYQTKFHIFSFALFVLLCCK